jgi:hypothetical protein
MPKYYSPDSQTLIVSSRSVEKGKLCFFTYMEGSVWSVLVLIVSVLIAYIMYTWLACSEVGSWLEKYFGSNACGGYIFIVMLWLVLMQFWYIFYRTEVAIKRDGRIARSTRVLGLIWNTITFEKGHYRFLVDGSYEEVYLSPEEGSGAWEANRMSIVDETGRRFALFIVPEYGGIKEFEKKFSDFTGFIPDVEVGRSS